MALHRWLGISLVIAIAAAFSACSNGKQSITGSTSGSGGAGTGTGGAGTGTGGAGPGTGGATSSTGAGKVDAGPIVCKSPSSYSTVPKGNCDILQQSCPAGQTCRPVQGANGFITECVGNTGLKTAAEVCINDSECDAKLFCVFKKCTPVCCRDNEEPCNGGICNINVPYLPYAIFVCDYSPKCNLLTPNACKTGFDCHISDMKQGLATCIEPSGANVPDLGSCGFLNDCATMQQCFQNDGLCHYYCTPGATSQAPGLGGCPPSQDCLTQYNNAPLDLGVPGVGLCFPNGNPPPPKDAGGD